MLSLTNLKLKTNEFNEFSDTERPSSPNVAPTVDPNPPKLSKGSFGESDEPAVVDKMEVLRGENSYFPETQVTVYTVDNPPKCISNSFFDSYSWMALDIETTGLDILKSHTVFSIQFSIPLLNKENQTEGHKVFVIYNVPEILESMQSTHRL